METNVFSFLSFILLGSGIVFGYFIRQFLAKKQIIVAENKAFQVLEEAKRKSKEKILDAKNKAVEILEEAKKKEKEREDYLRKSEDRLERKEENIEKKFSELEERKESLRRKVKEIQEIKKEIEQTREKEQERLEKIAGLNREQAKKILLQLVEEENRQNISKRIEKLERDGMEEIEKRSRDLIVQAVQKYASSHVAEITTSTVAIPSDEIKGRIIGREGRNIKALERITGVEIIVDDTPEVVVISCFNPTRREIARVALEKLIEDGRIHPSRIEDAVAYAKKEIEKKIKEAGETAVYDTGVVGLDKKLVYLLGRLRYRTSFGQNVLIHSIEVAHLAGALAVELGANVAVAKKAGLLHDIGKALDHEVQGTHVEIGVKILEKFGISKEVIDAVKSHHEEYPFETPESFLVAAADAISASRPGARKDKLEDYLKRLEELEGVALSFEEVDKAYAIQAGREIRIFVKPEKVDDLGALKLARKIADKIEEDLKYPGEIKVNVLRETRSVEYAR